MMSFEDAVQEVKRWKQALLAEVQKQTKIPWVEVDANFEYHDKLDNQVYAIAIGEPPGDSSKAVYLDQNNKVVVKSFPHEEKAKECMKELVKTGCIDLTGVDLRSLIVGVVIEEADVKTSPNRFVPHLVSSEVIEYSTKFKIGRNGYPHHIMFAPRANGIPSYKSVVNRAIKRSGVPSEQPKKAPVYVETSERGLHTGAVKISTTGKGYLLSHVSGSDDMLLHIGTLRLPKEKIDKIIRIIEDE